MRNAYEVLREKEQHVAQLQKEIDALKIVAPILHPEDEKPVTPTTVIPTTGTFTGVAGQLVTGGLPSSITPITAPSIVTTPVLTSEPVKISDANLDAVGKGAGWETAAKRWP